MKLVYDGSRWVDYSDLRTIILQCFCNELILKWSKSEEWWSVARLIAGPTDCGGNDNECLRQKACFFPRLYQHKASAFDDGITCIKVLMNTNDALTEIINLHC